MRLRDSGKSGFISGWLCDRILVRVRAMVSASVGFSVGVRVQSTAIITEHKLMSLQL